MLTHALMKQDISWPFVSSHAEGMKKDMFILNFGYFLLHYGLAAKQRSFLTTRRAKIVGLEQERIL